MRHAVCLQLRFQLLYAAASRITTAKHCIYPETHESLHRNTWHTQHSGRSQHSTANHNIALHITKRPPQSCCMPPMCPLHKMAKATPCLPPQRLTRWQLLLLEAPCKTTKGPLLAQQLTAVDTGRPSAETSTQKHTGRQCGQDQCMSH